MKITIHPKELIDLGVEENKANLLIKKIVARCNRCSSNEELWHHISQDELKDYSFAIHLFFFKLLFPHWHDHPEKAPAILPCKEKNKLANITLFMDMLGIQEVKTFHRFSFENYPLFWQKIIEKLHIVFKQEPQKICDLSRGIQSPIWLSSAKMNIVDSCFTANPSATALIFQDNNHQIRKLSYEELDKLSNRVANSLVALGYEAKDAIGIAMPMNVNAIAIYLGIIKMGGIVVSIADSFSSSEMSVRLQIANAKVLFTQDMIDWNGKKIPLYPKVSEIKGIKAIVLPSDKKLAVTLRTDDINWMDFLLNDTHFTSISCDPESPINILFSSGTTAEPKAIPWSHTTPIKTASDAFFHQNIKVNDVLAWPTNLGWMMGPWLIYAALINQATIALYPDSPKDRAFGEFIERAKVTMLGVVPTLVAMWRQTQCMEGLNWESIKTFSSTGECSNAEDMLYLMWLGNYKPIIEYCGGTEIGGAYVTSTVVEKNYPALFSTPAMGMQICILDENGHFAEMGEVAIIPPSIGLSIQLLNADHDQIYYANMPKSEAGEVLRRHGDQIKRLPNDYYMVLGRVDDTMNLGGIKVSSAEIERALSGLSPITETAAIAITPSNNGPTQLVIYAATIEKINKAEIHKEMQKRINAELNPLFKIHDVVLINELPKTASNKIMRRVLRKKYLEKL